MHTNVVFRPNISRWGNFPRRVASALTISIEPPKLTPADVAQLKAAEAKANDAQ
jgi:hypothetical protein